LAHKRQQAGKWRPFDVLVEFGEIVCQRGRAVAIDGQRVFQESGQAEGAFVEDEGVRRVLVNAEETLALPALLRGGKPRKVKLCSGSPESTTAMISPAAPGIIVTGRSASMARRTSE
jgi:hypothetical protein